MEKISREQLEAINRLRGAGSTAHKVAAPSAPVPSFVPQPEPIAPAAPIVSATVVESSPAPQPQPAPVPEAVPVVAAEPQNADVSNESKEDLRAKAEAINRLRGSGVVPQSVVVPAMAIEASKGKFKTIVENGMIVNNPELDNFINNLV